MDIQKYIWQVSEQPEAMVDFHRRTMLQKCAVSCAGLAGMSGLAAAETDRKYAEELSEGEARRAFGTAMRRRSVRQMLSFLREQHDTRPDYSTVVGFEVDPDGAQAHTLLQLPLKTDDTSDRLSIRMFDEDGQLVSSTINGSHFVIRSQDEGIVTGDELASDRDGSVARSSPETTADVARKTNTADRSAGTNCDNKATISTESSVCDFLLALGAIGSGVLQLIPEPGTTVVGTVALANITGGGCNAIEWADKQLTDCHVTALTLCVNWECEIIDLTVGYTMVCYPIVTAWPADC